MEVKLAVVVVLEGDGAAVVGPGVDLDHEPLLAPEEVDFPTAELDVDLWRRQVVATVESEEGGLEVAAGVIALDAVKAQPFVLGLANGATDEVRWNTAVEVFDRALDRGHRNAMAVGGEPDSDVN